MIEESEASGWVRTCVHPAREANQQESGGAASAAGDACGGRGAQGGHKGPAHCL